MMVLWQGLQFQSLAGLRSFLPAVRDLQAVRPQLSPGAFTKRFHT